MAFYNGKPIYFAPRVNITQSDEESYQRGYGKGYDNGYDIGSSEGFNNGYDSGKAAGIEEGYNNGYLEGYNAGHESGYDDGYAAGMESSYDTGYWDGYNNGETNGHQAGLQEGYQNGKEEGLEEGYGNGYVEGYGAGLTTGNAEGYENGKADGITEGIEQGKKSEHDKFWDAYQDYGNRTNYQRAFAGDGWTDTTFYPKYDIVFVGMNAGQSAFHISKIQNLKSRLEECGVVLDTSQCQTFYQAFQQSAIRVFPTIDMRNATDNTGYAFYNCGAETIEKVIISEQTNLAATTFGAMWELKNIMIEGTIAKGGLTFALSKNLTKASITSIINALSATTSGLAITFSQTAVNNAFTTDEWNALIATKPNWTISLV